MQSARAACPKSPGFGMPLASVAALSCLGGCSDAPSQSILGSFFPAWMVCAGVGIAAAAAVRILIGVAKLDDFILAPPVGYMAVAVAVTLLAWLYQFGQ